MSCPSTAAEPAVEGVRPQSASFSTHLPQLSDGEELKSVSVTEQSDSLLILLEGIVEVG